jgi:hypothetical protein
MPRPRPTSQYGGISFKRKKKKIIKRHPDRIIEFCPECGSLLVAQVGLKYGYEDKDGIEQRRISEPLKDRCNMKCNCGWTEPKKQETNENDRRKK